MPVAAQLPALPSANRLAAWAAAAVLSRIGAWGYLSLRGRGIADEGRESPEQYPEAFGLAYMLA